MGKKTNTSTQAHTSTRTHLVPMLLALVGWCREAKNVRAKDRQHSEVRVRDAPALLHNSEQVPPRVRIA